MTNDWSRQYYRPTKYEWIVQGDMSAYYTTSTTATTMPINITTASGTTMTTMSQTAQSALRDMAVSIDGARVSMEKLVAAWRNGNYDPNAPIERRPAPREFNKFINASDLMEEFIAFAGDEGVRQGEVLDLPVELFIKWLVLRALEQDNEDPGEVYPLVLPAPKQQPRCLVCKRFMPFTAKVLLDGEKCSAMYFKKQKELTSA